MLKGGHYSTPGCIRIASTTPPGELGERLAGLFRIGFQPGEIPNATMLVQRREWDACMDPDTAARRGFNPRDFDLGHKLRLLDGEHDVFGDGSVVCLPTHGHTPGHQSLRLRLDSGEVVLAADACYFCQTLRERRLPRNMYDREAMLASLDRLEALESSGARIFFGHDPEFWRSVPQAPAAIA